jgi:hypothetical protein
MHYFSCSGGTSTDRTKKCAGIRYAKLVFLHSMGSVGEVVHSGASGARNVDGLFFMLRWDRYRYDKKRASDILCRTCVFASGGFFGSRSAFWCVRGANVNTLMFKLGWDRYECDKKCAGTHYAEIVFLHPVGSGHETSTHYFSGSGGPGTDMTKKRAWIHYAELVFLHPVGSVGRIVHSGASVA